MQRSPSSTNRYCSATAGELPSRTVIARSSPCEELVRIALKLQERVNLSPKQRYRSVGVGLSNFREHEDMLVQSRLFD